MAEDVLITTSHGSYLVPAADLEKYKVEKAKAEHFETTGTVTVDPSSLRPKTDVRLRVGVKPVIRTKGSIIFSAETVASSSRGE